LSYPNTQQAKGRQLRNMSDPTTTTKDVKELVRKTWCEGPLTLKVGNIPFSAQGAL
jgi:hypothetical protein